MKQGSGNSQAGNRKVEPRVHGINPGGVAQIGSAIGNHTMEEGDIGYRGEKMHKDRGFEAPPLAKCEPHKAGSQGKYR